jgi:hypothetical protein
LCVMGLPFFTLGSSRRRDQTCQPEKVQTPGPRRQS